MPSPTATQKIVNDILLRRGDYDPALRCGYNEIFDKKPGVSGDYDPGTVNQAALRLYTAANKNFMVSGSNGTSALCTNAAGGGITLTTAGGANTTDAEQISPLLVNSAKVTPFNAITWDPAKSLVFRAWIKTQAAATTTHRLHVGLKLTANLDITTDADQCGFRIDTAVSAANWSVFQSVGAVNTLPTMAPAVPILSSTEYELMIATNASGVPFYYVNGVNVAVGTAMTAAALLIPVVGVIQVANSVTSAVTIRRLHLSRLL